MHQALTCNFQYVLSSIVPNLGHRKHVHSSKHLSGCVSWWQVLHRLPVILEALGVPSEDEDLVFLTRLLQVTVITGLVLTALSQDWA